jgi:hypothetical protein
MTENTNPLLNSFKLPGRIFQLPSRGLVYTNGEIKADVSEAEVHVKPMSAYDELVLKNPDMLFSGKAIEQVYPACIPDIAKPLELCGKDVDALMLYLRIVTYGPSYDITCSHGCEHGKSHSYLIDLETVLQKMKYLDPTTFEEIFNIKLDNGQLVVVQPVRYSHIIEILKLNENKKELSVEDMKINLTVNLLNVIKSIDGLEDKKLIEEWLRVAPAPYVNKIADAIEKTNDWGPDLDTTIICRDCGEEFVIQLPINPVSLFTGA